MATSIRVPFGTGAYDVHPTKVLALGLNYDDHIKESWSVRVRGFDAARPVEPVIFPKLPSSITPHRSDIVIPSIVAGYRFTEERTDYEGELAVILGRGGRNIAVGDAMDYILGYTCANDVSQRNIQTGDKSGWFRGKSFDTFLPLGPRVVAASDIADPHNLAIKTRLNGTVVQSGNTAQMIVSIPEMVAFLSRNFTLEEGDIILTGTPAGVGPLTEGDTVEVEIESIGTLSNRVVREQ